MGNEISTATDTVGQPGLPWPEAYRSLLPAIRAAWGVTDDIYLTRRLSGKSGAQVFAADVVSRDFTGQAILKLDRAPDPAWQERSEAERHRLAFESAPEFAAEHLPRLLHTLHHDSAMAILSAVAGRGLEYALPWHLCPYDRQLAVIRHVSADILASWNRDYRLAEGIQEPLALLARWLGYRLDPGEGRIHRFLADECGLSPQEPTVSFEGHWYPNPLAFATGVIDLPERLHLRAAKGHQHGDFHGFNLLVGSSPSRESEYFLIDLAGYEEDQFLFNDHALFELNYLLYARDRVADAGWETILDHLSYFRHLQGPDALHGDDIGLIEMVRALRREVLAWAERHEVNRLSFMESQYLLARVSAGLNFTNKSIAEPARRMAFLYAAMNLKDYLKIHDVTWPKHGPAFTIRDGARADTGMLPPGRARHPHAQRPTHPLLPDKPAIAVLAFDNLSGDAEQEYFADGVSLEIITALSRVDWLMVIARGSSFAYKGHAVDPKKVARELGVHYVVEGDVRRTDNRVRITVRLVDGRNGHAMWTEGYERDVEDVFALQDEIAQAIAGNIDMELKESEREAAHRKPEPLNVWDQFQKGMWHFFRFTPDDDALAHEHMTRLAEISPSFASAHAALAFLTVRKVMLGAGGDGEEGLRQALAHATRAVELDDRNSIAHMALGRVCTQMGDHDRAISECETAIALNPSSSPAYLCLAAALYFSGHADAALPPMDTSIRLSPKGPNVVLKLIAKAWFCYSLGRLQEAEDILRHVPHRRDPEPYHWLVLAAIHARQGRLIDARAAVERTLRERASMSIASISAGLRHMCPDYLSMLIGDLRKAGFPE